MIVWLAHKQFLIDDEFKFHAPGRKEGACLTRMWVYFVKSEQNQQ